MAGFSPLFLYGIYYSIFFLYLRIFLFKNILILHVMNKFICPRCHLNTHIRTHFKRHLTRKNICKPIYKDIPVKSIAESYGIDISSTENTGVIQKVIRITESGESNGLSNPDNKKEFILLIVMYVETILAPIF